MYGQRFPAITEPRDSTSFTVSCSSIAYKSTFIGYSALCLHTPRGPRLCSPSLCRLLQIADGGFTSINILKTPNSDDGFVAPTAIAKVGPAWWCSRRMKATRPYRVVKCLETFLKLFLVAAWQAHLLLQRPPCTTVVPAPYNLPPGLLEQPQHLRRCIKVDRKESTQRRCACDQFCTGADRFLAASTPESLPLADKAHKPLPPAFRSGNTLFRRRVAWV